MGYAVRRPPRSSRLQRKEGFHWERWLVRGTLFAALFPVLLVLVLRWVDPPITSFMLGTKLELMRSGAKDTRIRYRWVDYNQIAPAMKLAAMAAEDQRFPDHGGFDWDAIGKAMQHNQRRKNVRGASTISQQVVKNLFLWENRSWLRKGVETYLTFWMELLWSKQRILEIYLNIAQFGPNVFGVGAAAPNYFNRPAAQLNASQAALLAAVLPAPRRLKVYAPSSYVRARQGWILRQMGGLGYAKLRELQASDPEPVKSREAAQKKPTKPATRPAPRPSRPTKPKPPPVETAVKPPVVTESGAIAPPAVEPVNPSAAAEAETPPDHIDPSELPLPSENPQDDPEPQDPDEVPSSVVEPAPASPPPQGD